MIYRYSGRSGIQLPVLSLGLWHNFGSVDNFDTATQMVVRAFDKGICHFDLANNYGPPYGSAETTFGRVMDEALRPARLSQTSDVSCATTSHPTATRCSSLQRRDTTCGLVSTAATAAAKTS